MRTILATLAAGSVLLGLCSSPAQAHRIDGEWCKDGASLTIEENTLRMPSGKTVTGNRNRWMFQYVEPEGEKDPGADVEMEVLHDDESMRLRRRTAGAEAPEERWERCRPAV